MPESDFHAGIAEIAQDLDHAADRRRVAGRLFDQFDFDHAAGSGLQCPLALLGRGQHDLLTDAAVLGDAELHAVLFDDAGDQTRIAALGDLHHPALTAAAAIKSGDAHQHTVAMQHAAHFLRAEEDVPLVAFLTLLVRLAVTGDDETEPVRVSFDSTRDEVCLVGNDVGIASVAHQLRLALHRAQAAHEVLALLGLDVQRLHELVGAHRHAGLFERLHDVLAARQGIVVTRRLAFEERVGASDLAR